MERFISATLSALIMTMVSVPTVHAQVPAVPSRAGAIEITTTPFDLVSLAYQGFLESENIPKFNRLIFAYRTGKLEIEDLVQAAINTRRLPAEAINDRRYLSAVERQLDNLLNGSSN